MLHWSGVMRRPARTHARHGKDPSQVGKHGDAAIVFIDPSIRNRRPDSKNHILTTTRRTIREGWVIPVIMGLVMGLTLALGSQLFIGEYQIPSASMEPTLLVGDRIATTKMWLHGGQVSRGDIIVFEDPGNWINHKTEGTSLVKRVIGVGGDKVSSNGMSGVEVNGRTLDEKYVMGGETGSMAFSVTVPQGYVFVMGDNRDNSADSRFHTDDGHGGMVPLSSIDGIATAVFLPLDRLRLM